MEVAGFVIGAVSLIGIAGLYSTCLQVLEQIDTGCHLNSTASPLSARWAASQHLLKVWGDKIGIQDGAIHTPYHPKLDDEKARGVVFILLATVENIMSDQKRLSDRYGLSTQLHATSLMTNVTEFVDKISSKGSRTRINLRRRVRWAVTDQPKFTVLIKELEVIVDRLYVTIPPEKENKDELPRLLENLRSRIDDGTRDTMKSMEALENQQRDLISRFDAQERNDVLNWLKPVYTAEEFDEAVRERSKGTCEWIFNPDGPFDQWTGSDAKCLWMHASAGFGKTFISAKLVEYLRNTSSHPLAYFFCVYSDEKKSVPISILRSWIAQIAKQHMNAFEEVRRMRKGRETELPTSSELWSLFRTIIIKVPNCRFVADGFDECSTTDPHERSHFSGARYRFLQNILTSIASSTAAIIIVSRDETDIREGLGRTAPISTDSRVVEYAITEDDTKDDIKTFAEGIVLEKLRTKEQAVQEKIALGLSSKAQGMFLWVRLEKDRLKSSLTPAQLQETISNMPTGLHLLSRTYERSLSAISELQELQDKERAQNILRWTLFAARPMSVRELFEALVIRDDMEELPRDLPDPICEQHINEISALCGSLIKVKDQTGAGTAAYSTVHLAHFSLKEFLLKNTRSTVDNLYKCSELNHGLLAKACLTYLLFRSFEDGPCPTDSLLALRKEKFAFLKYAAKHWPYHARLHASLDQSLIPKSLALLDCESQGQNFRAWIQVYHNESSFFATANDYLTNGSDYPVYYSALFGLAGELQEQIHRGVDVNARGGKYGNALQAAALFGYKAVVQLLLEQKADVDAKTVDGSTALHRAAREGHEAAVRLLLEYKADIYAKTKDGWTSLHEAAWQGHEAVVQLLLEHKADVDAKTEHDWTALHRAARKGHEAVVRLLLKHKADVDAKTEDGETALQEAAWEGHEAAVRLLLEHKADINAKTKYGRTAMHEAAWEGHESLVRLLLEHKADIYAKTTYGWTALHWAAIKGHEAVVRLLLEHKADVDAKTEDGSTALRLAARKGHKAVVRLLISSAHSF